MTLQPGLRVTSRPENSQVGPTELKPRADPESTTSPLTHPLKSLPASHIQDVNTTAGVKTQAGLEAVGSTNGEENKPKTLTKEVNEGGASDPEYLYLYLQASTESSIITRSPTVETLEATQHPTQVYHPSVITRTDTELLKNVETAILSPRFQAPGLSESARGDVEPASSERSFNTSAQIKDATTESLLVAPSRHSSSEAGADPTVPVSFFSATGEDASPERTAAEDSAASQKRPAVLTPTSESRALSSSEIETVRNISDRESGREADEIDLGVEEEVEIHGKVEEDGSNGDIDPPEKYNPPLPEDSIQSEMESPLQTVNTVSQPPTYTVNTPSGGERRPGIRGQRVRQ